MRAPALLFLLLLASVAAATTSEDVDVTCPLCGNEFRAEQWHSTNSVGGQDRDFLQHAAGGQVFLMACWTCPRCAYTGFGDDFDAESAPEELIARLKKANPLRPAEPIDPATEHCGKIPAWVRYDLWIQMLKLDAETTESQLAFANLRTGQTQRFEWRTLDGIPDFETRSDALYERVKPGLPEGSWYDRSMACGRAYEKLAADPESKLDASDRLFARVLAALAGEELDASFQAVVGEIRARVARERVYRERAIPHLEKHVAGAGLAEEEAIALRYLLGVLYRRVGKDEEAVAALEPLLAAEGVPEGFMDWIKDELAKAKRG